MKHTKKQLAVIKDAYEQVQNDYRAFLAFVKCNEEWMQKETGIKNLKFLRHPKHGQFTGVGIQKVKVK